MPRKDTSRSFLSKQKAEYLVPLYHQIFPSGTATHNRDRIDALVMHYDAVSWKPAGMARRNAKDVSLVDLARRITVCLDERQIMQNVNVVLIENQISPLAARMKCIQGMLTQYCVMRSHAVSVEYISSSCKLKHLKSTSTATTGTTTPKLSSSYQENKKTAIQVCGDMMKSNDEAWNKWLPFWETNKKKQDDLADCLLQALAWIRRGVADETVLPSSSSNIV